MSGSEEKQDVRAAAELLTLLTRLAHERPEIVEALVTLLRALLGERTAHARTGHTSGSATPAPETPREAPCELPCELPRELLRDDTRTLASTPQAQNGASQADTNATSPLPASAPNPTPIELPPTVATALAPVVAPDDAGESTVSIDSSADAREGGDHGLAGLLARFDPNRKGGGLSGVRVAASAPATTPPYFREADVARKVSTVATAQAKRLRLARRARADGHPTPAPSERLADACLNDWTAEPRALVGHEPRELRIVERWYELLARAFDELERWFASRRTMHLTLQDMAELKDRIGCAALAQKGVYSWIRRKHCRGTSALAVCGVQQFAFETIRSWARRRAEGGFEIFIESGLRLDQEITTEEQRRIDSTLDGFEVIDAPDELPGTTWTAAATEQAQAAEEGESAEDRIESVADAFERARQRFADLLVFTDRAEDSAERSPFRRANEVFEFFETLHGIARDLAAGSLDGQPLDDVFEQRGFAKKPCSKKTMKRHHRFYHMIYRGREVDLSQHITLGSRNQNTCLSIHWWHDEERGQFVIGHCGKHLPNTMT
jgi:hypothetical protein